MATQQTAPRRVGRPREEDIAGRVIRSVVELLLADDTGRGVTMTAITAQSGVSRAAIYRRWPSLEAVIVAALDSNRAPVVVPDSGDLLADLLVVYTTPDTALPENFDRLLRRRIVLALNDPQLARVYWGSHVARRREPVVAALRRGKEHGIVRQDVDLEATIDLIAGIHYYQLVVRGTSLSNPESIARVEAGIRTVWRGIAA